MYRKIKVIIDFVIAALFIALFWPIFLFLALILAIHLRENPFFIQKRIGYKEKVFRIIKFKTLPSTDNETENYDHFCTWLRTSSLDELPQFFNVLAGNMVLIGPRPLLPEYLPLYTEEQRKRHDVKPGISGLVQVMGGNALTWEQRFRLDRFYVNHVNAKMDGLIFIKTVKQIFSLGSAKKHFSKKYTV